MHEIDLEEFTSSSFEDFQKMFLTERKLDGTTMPKMGEISNDVSRVNQAVAKKLNKWAAQISNKVNRYVSKVLKRDKEARISVRHIKSSDGKSEEASIVLVRVLRSGRIKNGEIQVAVIDSNRIAISISKNIAKLLGLKQLRKVVANRDVATGFAINILERI